MTYSSQTRIDTTLPTAYMADYSFDKWVYDKRKARGLGQKDLAELAGTTKQTISSIERQAKHPRSDAPYRPTPDMVDAIANALDESTTEARLAAGILPVGYEKHFNIEEERLIKYYHELPRECQLDVLALTEALWRRRRPKGKIKSNAREVPKPQELPDHKRRVS